jgi:adenine-specific DNA-methyltransferase
MRIETRTPLKSLNPAYRKEKVSRKAIDRLKQELPLFLDRTRGKISESTLRDHLQTLLRGVAFPAEDFLVQSEVRRMDTVIHDGPKRKDAIGVIIEAKTTENSNEMFSTGKPNVKSLHELVLYFLRERHAGNTAIKNLLITNGDELYIFADKEFERLFWDKKRFRKKILDADADAGKNNDLIYEAIKKHVAELDDTLTVTQTRLELFRTYCEDNDQETDSNLIPLYKLLSPEHLLRRPFAGDSNHLDKGFYRELLHIIGLHEVNKKNGKIVKSGGKKVIERLPEGQRHPASLLENTLQVATKENRFRNVKGLKDYGSNEEERRFSVALELCLSWVNRILFLKLLETQLLSYHRGDKAYRFLSPERIPDFDALNTLFFDVLNKPVAERESIVHDFARVPYLNSSLFEISELEDQVIRVNSLKDQFLLDLAPQSVLSTSGSAKKMQPLAYLFRFLDAYDFGGEGKASIQEDNKRLINASVLGLIFEKINGYRDGSFYTPGFITEYMCRQTIRRAVVQKFREDDGQFADFDAEDFDALRNYLGRDNYKREVRAAANALINTLTVCDPAVGSGHFLVSALNELIATKSALGILGADAGAKDIGISAMVENDELLVSWRREGEPYEYRVDVDSNAHIRVPPEIQAVQETLFQEKRTLIENCLFGVDLNPNSVKICRLRLWIELLKNAYYCTDGTGNLETLPNIDINIKQGNSLISRFALDDDLSDALKDSNLTLSDYHKAVTLYHRAQGRESKEQLLSVIESIKNNFQSHIAENDPKIKRRSNLMRKVRDREIALNNAVQFGFNPSQIKKIKEDLKPIRKKFDKLNNEIQAIENNAIYEQAFEWRFEFPAVLGEDGRYLGFDVVVGNPPYGVSISQDYLLFYKQYFDHMVGIAEVYYLFVERILNDLLCSGGYTCLIIPNAWMTNKYAKSLRKFLINSVNINQIINLNDTSVFEEANVTTSILLAQRNSPVPLVIVGNNLDSNYEFEQNIWGENDHYLINFTVSREATNVLLKMNSNCPPLSDVLDISNGCKPYQVGYGKNREGIPMTKEDVKNKIYHFEEYHEGLRVELRGKNIGRYTIQYPKLYVEWGPWLMSPVPKKYFDNPRILVRKITSQYLYCSLDDSDAIANQSLYVCIEYNDKPDLLQSVLAILNSKLMGFYFRKWYSEEDDLFPQIKVNELKGLPTAPLGQNIRIRLKNLVTSILSLKSTDPVADTSALEAEIDVLVYKLYGLTYAEVVVVDPEFGLSEAEYSAVQVTRE